MHEIAKNEEASDLESTGSEPERRSTSKRNKVPARGSAKNNHEATPEAGQNPGRREVRLKKETTFGTKVGPKRGPENVPKSRSPRVNPNCRGSPAATQILVRFLTPGSGPTFRPRGVQGLDNVLARNLSFSKCFALILLYVFYRKTKLQHEKQ